MSVAPPTSKVTSSCATNHHRRSCANGHQASTSPSLSHSEHFDRCSFFRCALLFHVLDSTRLQVFHTFQQQQQCQRQIAYQGVTYRYLPPPEEHDGLEREASGIPQHRFSGHTKPSQCLCCRFKQPCMSFMPQNTKGHLSRPHRRLEWFGWDSSRTLGEKGPFKLPTPLLGNH